jgi:hypothetical protein
LATASSGDVARPNSMGTLPGLQSVVPHRVRFAETGGAGGSRACPLHRSCLLAFPCLVLLALPLPSLAFP